MVESLSFGLYGKPKKTSPVKRYVNTNETRFVSRRAASFAYGRRPENTMFSNQFQGGKKKKGLCKCGSVKLDYCFVEMEKNTSKSILTQQYLSPEGLYIA